MGRVVKVNLFYFMYLYVVPPLCIPGTLGDQQQRALDPLELELWTSAGTSDLNC